MRVLHVAQRKFSPAASCPPACGPGTALRAAGTPGSQLQGWKPASVLHRDSQLHPKCCSDGKTKTNITSSGWARAGNYSSQDTSDLSAEIWESGTTTVETPSFWTSVLPLQWHTSIISHVQQAAAAEKKAFSNPSLAAALTHTPPRISSTHELKRKPLFSAGLVNWLLWAWCQIMQAYTSEQIWGEQEEHRSAREKQKTWGTEGSTACIPDLLLMAHPFSQSFTVNTIIM